MPRTNVEYSIMKMRVKTKPETLVTILRDVRPISLTRQEVWLRIMDRINRAVSSLLDGRGVVGMVRVMYHDYAKTLWKWLKKYPEHLWDKFVEAETHYYARVHGLSEEVLGEVAEVVKKVIRELLEVGLEVGPGGEEARGGGAGQAVGEGGGGGGEGGGQA